MEYFRHWLFEEFLSHDECANLIKVHREHVKKMKSIDPIICFDSIQTLRKHLKELKPNTNIPVTPNDFTAGRMTLFSLIREYSMEFFRDYMYQCNVLIDAQTMGFEMVVFHRFLPWRKSIFHTPIQTY